MADKPKLRWHRAQWDLLVKYGSPAFFFEQEYGSPIESESDWGSPESVVEAPISAKPPAFFVTPSSAAPPIITPPSPAPGSSPKSTPSSEERSGAPIKVNKLIEDYRREIRRIRESALKTGIELGALDSAESSFIYSGVVKAATATPSTEEEDLVPPRSHRFGSGLFETTAAASSVEERLKDPSCIGSRVYRAAAKASESSEEELIPPKSYKFGSTIFQSPALGSSLERGLAKPSHVGSKLSKSAATTFQPEERLAKSTVDGKADRKVKPGRPENSRGRKISSNQKLPRVKRDTTPTPRNPRALPKRPPLLDQSLESKYLLKNKIDGTTPDFSHPQCIPPLPPSYIYKMINSKAISDLLTENVDENTTDWVLFTIYGNLLGYSDDTPTKKARTCAAMAGGAWRIHNQALRNGDATSHATADKFCKTLETIPYDESENGLRAMIVVVDDMAIAVHDVKERLLIGAMLPLDTVKRDDAGSSDASDEESATEATDQKSDADDSDSSVKSSSSVSRTTRDDARYRVRRRKRPAKKENTDSNNSSASKEDNSPPKKQILLWRAEGMAETLLGDLRSFRMPDGYF